MNCIQINWVSAFEQWDASQRNQSCERIALKPFPEQGTLSKACDSLIWTIQHKFALPFDMHFGTLTVPVLCFHCKLKENPPSPPTNLHFFFQILELSEGNSQKELCAWDCSVKMATCVLWLHIMWHATWPGLNRKRKSIRARAPEGLKKRVRAHKELNKELDRRNSGCNWKDMDTSTDIRALSVHVYHKDLWNSCRTWNWTAKTLAATEHGHKCFHGNKRLITACVRQGPVKQVLSIRTWTVDVFILRQSTCEQQQDNSWRNSKKKQQHVSIFLLTITCCLSQSPCHLIHGHRCCCCLRLGRVKSTKTHCSLKNYCVDIYFFCDQHHVTKPEETQKTVTLFTVDTRVLSSSQGRR